MKKSISFAVASQQNSGINSDGKYKPAMKEVSQTSRSESTLSCRSQHEWCERLGRNADRRVIMANYVCKPFLLFRARPTKFVSKFIIGSIWFIALSFAIPCAIAFRVEDIHERIKGNLK